MVLRASFFLKLGICGWICFFLFRLRFRLMNTHCVCVSVPCRHSNEEGWVYVCVCVWPLRCAGGRSQADDQWLGDSPPSWLFRREETPSVEKKKKCFYPPSVQRRGNALAVFELCNSIRATRAVRSSQGAESGPGSHDFLYNCVGIQAEIFLPQKYLTSVYSQWEKKNNALLDGQHVSQGDT